MNQNNVGQIIVPTGGGKTYIMIQDLIKNLDNNVTVIVAPRILLAQQLCDDFITSIDKDLNVFHAHSGRTSFKSSTKPDEIAEFVNNNSSVIIFTTYHSLSKIVDSGINLSLIHI